MLVLEIRIRGYQHGEPFVLRGMQKLAVLQGGPAAFIRRGYFMLRQYLPKGCGRSLIKEDSHLRRDQSASRRVLEYCTHLLESYSGKPLYELRDGSTILKILEKGRNGNAGPAKHPGSANALRIALNSLAGGPVNHG